MGCRCKERAEFLKQRMAQYRAARASGHTPPTLEFLKETARKLPLGSRNLPQYNVSSDGWIMAPGFEPPGGRKK